MSPHFYLFAEDDIPFEDTTRIDDAVLARLEGAANDDRLRGPERYPSGHDRGPAPVLKGGLKLRELGARIGTAEALRIGLVLSKAGHAIGPGKSNQIGEVELPLGIIRRKGAQPTREGGRGEAVDSGVDFPEGALGLRGILFLDDTHQGACVIAQHASKARGVGEGGRHHAHRVRGHGGKEGFKGRRFQQGHIPREHQYALRALGQGKGRPHRIPRTALIVLAR